LTPELRLTTERLVLRPFEPADAPRMVEIQSNWKVTRMLRLAPWPPSLEAMTNWVEEHAREWVAGEACRFAVTLDGQVIGAVDIDGVTDGEADLGYWFDEPWWGGGYATEAASALLRFAFQDLKLTRITAGHAADNPASGKVLAKLGFRVIEQGVRHSGPRGEAIPYVFLELVPELSLFGP
jgi:[ribosomal protein S5]-alanine N-acetyltransferase